MNKSKLLVAFAALLASSACGGEKANESANAPAGPIKPVAPPPGGDWSQVVSQTAEGGFVMGNPNADVKLIEFASMTCPHCAEFEHQGGQALIDKYVKTGRVSFELRNFVRDPFDIAATLLARCNGASSFFPLTRQLFATQKDWINKLSTLSPEQQQQIQAMQPAQQFPAIAQAAGLTDWAAMRGIPAAKANQCLTSQPDIDRLVQMQGDAVSQFNIPGTPAFVINGKLVEDATTWKTLEPKLREAIGS